MKKKLLNLMGALFLTIFLSNHLEPIQIDLKTYQQISTPVLKFLYHLTSDLFVQLSSISAVYLFMLLGIYLLLTFLDKNAQVKLSKFQLFLSLILSLGILFRYSFSLPLAGGQTSYFYLLVENGVQIFKTICTFISWFVLYNLIQKCFELSLIKFTDFINSYNWKKTIQDQKLKKKSLKTYFKITGLIFVMWLPSMLIDYPAVLIYDGLTQLFQFHGYAPLRTDHPISSTLFINGFFDLGKSMGSPKFGLFMGVVVQSLILAAAFAIVVLAFKILMKKPLVWKVLALLIGILPMTLSFIPLVTKDVIFSAAFILFVFCLSYWLFNPVQGNQKTVLINMTLWSTVALLFRKNVVYVIVLFMLYSLILLIFRSRTVNWSLILVLTLSVILFKGVDLGLATAYHADTETLKRESLSIPFQQTARYIKYHGNEMSKTETQKINRVLRVDNISARYNPLLSNEVKLYDNEEATSSEWKGYFETWLYEFTQHPVTYFEATIQQNISLISPFDRNVYFSHLDNGYRPGMSDRNQFLVKNKLISFKIMWSLQEIKLQYYKIFDRLPLIGLLDNPAIYIIVSLFVLSLAFKFKLKRTVYLMMPTLLLLLTLIAGPIVQGYTRYTAIFPFVFPIFILAFSMEFKQGGFNYEINKWRKKGRY